MSDLDLLRIRTGNVINGLWDQEVTLTMTRDGVTTVWFGHYHEGAIETKKYGTTGDEYAYYVREDGIAAIVVSGETVPKMEENKYGIPGYREMNNNYQDD